MAFKKVGIIEHDPYLGRTETLHYDADNDRFAYETDWSVHMQRVYEANKAMRNQLDERAGWKGDQHWIAQIPANVAHDLRQRTANGKDKAAVARWINDPHNPWLTRPVKL